VDKNKELIDLAIILHKQSGSVEPFGKASTGDIDRAYADAQEIIDEGFSRRPEPLVRGMEIDVDSLAYELCKMFADDFYVETPQHFKDMANNLKANAHVWLKEMGGE